ncbi:unnamed protein product [Vicia faba]|uniref:GUN4-like domain-containing protein n=1 Tax=Vicia faba TaxID=3906 RepID=A0AAV1B5V9_VICFA|nr:unnamed protein product [Vicia faba]
MATNSLHSIQHHSLIKRQYYYPSETAPPSTLSSSLFLKPTSTSISLSHSSTSNTFTTFSLSQTTSSTPSSTSQSSSFELLQQLLSAKNFREADDETRRLLIVLAGEAAQKRGYVFFSEVQFISETDLQTIDKLWREHSDNKFGYSVQKKLFEFIWELNDDTPEGHLPLTNALRGTQLLSNIFSHPAFDAVQDEVEVSFGGNGAFKGLKDSSKTSAQNMLKTDYSF